MLGVMTTGFVKVQGDVHHGEGENVGAVLLPVLDRDRRRAEARSVVHVKDVADARTPDHLERVGSTQRERVVRNMEQLVDDTLLRSSVLVRHREELTLVHEDR